MRSKTSRFLILYNLFIVFTGMLGYLSNPDNIQALLIPVAGAILLMIWRSQMNSGELWGYSAAMTTVTAIALYYVSRIILPWFGRPSDYKDTLLSIVLILMICAGSLLMIYVMHKDWKRQKKFFDLLEGKYQ